MGPWRPLEKTSWRKLFTPPSQRSTWMLTPSSISTHAATLSLEAPWEMLVSPEERLSLILMEVGEPMVVVLSLARITPRWTEVLPMLLDGSPSLLLRLDFARGVSYRFPTLLELQNPFLLVFLIMELEPNPLKNLLKLSAKILTSDPAVLSRTS